MNTPSDFRDKWVSSVSPNESYKFDRRIDWDNISECELYESFTNPDQFFTPEFLSLVKTNIKFIQSCLSQHSNLPLDPVHLHERRSFVDLWSPLRLCVPNLLNEAYPDLYSLCTKLAITNIIDLLIDRLVDLSDRLLWNYFLKFRSPGSFFISQMKIYQDEPPPRTVYQDFIFSLRSDSLKSLFLEFPVYEFFVGVIYTHWWSFVNEFLDRLIVDRLSIESRFSIPTSFLLSGIEGNLSDPHRFSRSVLILTFSPTSDLTSDDHYKLVYKPKSLTLEVKYYEFLSCLNSFSQLSPFKLLTILSLDNYGYVEYISRDNYTPQEDLPSFYFMVGRLSAVLWLLGCTDLHHENLILSSNQLILVDAETIFDSPLPTQTNTNSISQPTQLERLVFRSLLTCGLLPFWTHYGSLNTPIDISALGIQTPSSPIQSNDGWVNINTDAMTAGSIEVPTKVSTTLPYNIGTKNIFNKFNSHFIAGFESQCDSFILFRNQLLIADGPIDSFLGITRRALIRATQTYYTMQRKQFLPSALSSFVNQFFVLEKLSRGFLTYIDKPNHWPIFHSEKHQMINLDIPMFDHKIGSSDFVTSLNSDTKLHFPDAHASVRKRLADLDADSKSFQLILIRGSFDSSSLHIPELLDFSDFKDVSYALPDTCFSKLPDFSSIFILTLHELIYSSYSDSFFRCQWLGYNLHVSNVYSFYSLNCSLFSGIASFPSYIQLAYQTNDHNTFLNSSESTKLEKILESVNSTLTYWIDHSDSPALLRWWRDCPHGINGCGGHLLSLSLSSSINTDSFLIPEAFDLCVNPLRLSIMNGPVGLIPALTTIGSSSSLSLSHRLGKHICSELLTAKVFQGDDPEFPLGFFHGSSGLIAVFARLYLSSPDDTYIDLAQSALDYERSLIIPGYIIPPVIHTSFFKETSYSVKDCKFSLDLANGLSGILLSRICLYGTPLWDKKSYLEVVTYLEFILKYRHLLSGINLAHGRLGVVSVVELALTFSLNLPSELVLQLQNFIFEQRELVIKQLSSPSPDFYPNRNLSVPPLGFFNGLVGISYYFKSTHSSPTDFWTLFTGGLFNSSSINFN